MATTLPWQRYRREAIPHPEAVPSRALLTLALTPVPVAYAIRSEWSEFHAGAMQRTILKKTLTLRLTPNED